MGHLVSFLPHLPRHPPSLLRPYTPHLPTRHSKSPLVMNNSQQFLLDFTHTHTNSQQICNVYVLGSIAGKKTLRCCYLYRFFLQVLNNGWVSICTLVHESIMYSLVVRSTFSLIRCTHTHIHLHTHTTHTGSDHLTLLTEHGDIYTLGCAEQGQLGRVPECFSSRGGRKGTSLLLRPDIVRFRVKKGAGKPKFSDVFCCPYHTFAATQRGEVYVWGLNNYGQLCTGDSKNRYQPELLEGGLIGGRGLGVAKDFCVASGGHHTVVCCDGEVFTCGRKEYIWPTGSGERHRGTEPSDTSGRSQRG